MTTTYRDKHTGKLMLEPESVTRARELREWNAEQETQESDTMGTRDTFKEIVAQINEFTTEFGVSLAPEDKLLSRLRSLAANAAEAEDCNGWCNRETWAVWDWFQLPEAVTHRRACARLHELDSPVSVEINLQTYVEIHGPKYAIGSLWRVDWKAIAEALVESEDNQAPAPA